MTPHLPPELIHRIIALSLPETVSFALLPKRYRLLLSYPLVGRAWTPWAQLELFRHARVVEDPERFSQAVEGAEVDLLKHVVSMRLKGMESCDNMGVESVLEKCSGLRHLFVEDHCC